MIYTVNPMENINFGATGDEEILQNVAFILSSFKMSCPLDREFGYKPPLDAPLRTREALNTARIIEAINDFEPRAEVVEVEVISDPNTGHITSKAKVRPNAESI